MADIEHIARAIAWPSTTAIDALIKAARLKGPSQNDADAMKNGETLKQTLIRLEQGEHK